MSGPSRTGSHESVTSVGSSNLELPQTGSTDQAPPKITLTLDTAANEIAGSNSTASKTAPSPSKTDFLAGFLAAGSFLMTPLWFTITIAPAVIYKVAKMHKNETLSQAFQSGIGFAFYPILKAASLLDVAEGKPEKQLSSYAPTAALDPTSSFEEKTPRLIKELMQEAEVLKEKAITLEQRPVNKKAMTREEFDSYLREIHAIYAKVNEKYAGAYKLDPKNQGLIKAWKMSISHEHTIPVAQGITQSRETIRFIEEQITDFEKQFSIHLRTLRLAEFVESPQSSKVKPEDEIPEKLNMAIKDYTKMLEINGHTSKNLIRLQARYCEALLYSLNYPTKKIAMPLEQRKTKITELLKEIQKSDLKWRANFPRLSRLENKRIEGTLDRDFAKIGEKIPKNKMGVITGVNLDSSDFTFYERNATKKISKKELTQTLEVYNKIKAHHSSTFTAAQRVKLEFMIMILHHLLALDCNQTASRTKIQQTPILEPNFSNEETQRDLKKYHSYLKDLRALVTRLDPTL